MWISRCLYAATCALMVLASDAGLCQPPPPPPPPLNTGVATIGALDAAGSSGFVDIHYTDSAGTPIGTPQKHVPIDPTTREVILKPTAAQGAVGNIIKIQDNNIDRTHYRTLKIETTVVKGKLNTVVMPSRPEPGKQSPMSLGPDLPDLPELIGPGSTSRRVVASNFDLFYTALGGDLFDVSITGDGSFIHLDDQTYMDFADGSHFGTIQISPIVDVGVFDFVAIGMSGTWTYDPLTGQTSTDVTRYEAFSVTSISVIAEPASILLVLGALGGLGLLRRARKPGLRSVPGSTCRLAPLRSPA